MVERAGRDVLQAGDCVVCMTSLGDAPERLVRLPCRHIMHDECLKGWMTSRSSCPVCRRPFRMEDTLVYSTVEDLKHRALEMVVQIAFEARTPQKEEVWEALRNLTRDEERWVPRRQSVRM